MNSVGLVFVKRIGQIEELRQQDYHGKRIYIEISDMDNYLLQSKIDIGVHKNLDISQEEFCFDIGYDETGVNLLANSKEQIVAEKIRPILKFGTFSTRYKDMFDIYYLCDHLDEKKMIDCLNTFIFNDEGMRENNIDDIIRRLDTTFSDSRYLTRLRKSRTNWIDADVDDVLAKILSFIKGLGK